MKLLAVVAHPDDAAIFCGGTLAKHVDRGDEVHVTYMTRGEYGGLENQTEDEIAERRVEEARNAAGELGVTTSFLDFKDGRLEYSLENRRILTDVIRKRQPDSLLTHYRQDAHPDHRVTGRLVSDAYYQASLPKLESDRDPWDPENVYYFGKPESGFDPEIYVNLRGVLETKEKAIRCHESQVAFLELHGGIDASFEDLVEDVLAENRVYGRRSGVSHAEGFIPLHQVARDSLGG